MTLLKDIVQIEKGRKYNLLEENQEGAIRVFQANDFRNENKPLYTKDTDGVLANEDDIMLVWDGSVGQMGFGRSGYVGSTMVKLKVKNKKQFSPFFIYRFLQTKAEYLKRKATGATIMHINRKSLEQLEIPDLEIDDQLHIANLLSKAENLISQRKESICLLDEFLKSTFKHLFGNVTNNEKGFDKMLFAKVALNENSKRIPIRQSDRDAREGIYPYYGATGIIDTIDDYKFDGDYLLIAEDGKNLLFRKKNNAFMATGRFWVNNHAHVLSFNGVCNLKYLEFFLNSIDFRPYITGIDQVKLNKENLDRIPVPVPPIQLQTRFAQIVERTETLKTQYQQSLQELENLYGSLSQKAFRGELSINKAVSV